MHVFLRSPLQSTPGQGASCLFLLMSPFVFLACFSFIFMACSSFHVMAGLSILTWCRAAPTWTSSLTWQWHFCPTYKCLYFSTVHYSPLLARAARLFLLMSSFVFLACFSFIFLACSSFNVLAYSSLFFLAWFSFIFFACSSFCRLASACCL